MKKLFILLFISLIFSACQSDAPKEEATMDEPAIEAVTISFDQFKVDPEQYVDKYVKIEGTCVHTCKHGGKKMHMVGADPDYTVKVLASETVPMFDKELEGSKVTVEGYVRAQRIDKAYLNNWESELKQDIEKQKESGEVNEEHHESMMQIANMRKELEESGKEQISYYSIECSKFEEKAQS